MQESDSKGRPDPIRRFLKEFASLPPAIRILFKFGGVALVSMVFGFAPEEGLGSTLYGNTVLGALSPFVAVVAAILGLLVALRLHDRESVWVWVPGVIWFALGAYDVGWPASASLSSNFSSAVATLFEGRDKCAESECLYELFYTTPLVCSITYSLAAWVTLKFSVSGKSAG
jgi:hypothetical protein